MFIFAIFHRYFPFKASEHSWTVSPFRMKASSPFSDIPADPPVGSRARKHLWHADSWASRRQDMQALDLWIRHAAMAHKSLCTQCNSSSQCHGWPHFSQVQIMPKRLFNFLVPRLNDAESGALLPAQESKTKVSSCSVPLDTLSPEGFPAPHGSVNRLSRAGTVPAPSPASPSSWTCACQYCHMHQQHSLTQVNSAKNLQANLGIHSVTPVHSAKFWSNKGSSASPACVSKGKGLQQQA